MWFINTISKASSCLINASVQLTSIRNGCYRSSIGRIKRSVFSRLYPVTLVKPDGSSITIKYHEPVAVIKLPFDVNQLDDIERKKRLLKRQMSNKIDARRLNENKNIIDKSLKFNPKKYLNLNNKKDNQQE